MAYNYNYSYNYCCLRNSYNYNYYQLENKLHPEVDLSNQIKVQYKLEKQLKLVDLMDLMDFDCY